MGNSSNSHKFKLPTSRKGKILCAKVDSGHGSFRFYDLYQSFLRNLNHHRGLRSLNSPQSNNHFDSKVSSANSDGYVISAEEDASSLSETEKSGTKILIPGLPDGSNGESPSPISSCFWEWKPKFTVHYEKAGCDNVGSPPVLFLPGFGVGSFHYEKQLKDLGRDFRIWAIDFLGQGMSLPSEDPAPLSKERGELENRVLTWGFGDQTEPWANELVYSIDLWRDQVRYFIEQVPGCCHFPPFSIISWQCIAA